MYFTQWLCEYDSWLSYTISIVCTTCVPYVSIISLCVYVCVHIWQLIDSGFSPDLFRGSSAVPLYVFATKLHSFWSFGSSYHLLFSAFLGRPWVCMKIVHSSLHVSINFTYCSLSLTPGGFTPTLSLESWIIHSGITSSLFSWIIHIVDTLTWCDTTNNSVYPPVWQS